MIKVKETIIVEGKYDKIRLSQLVDGTIIQTNGFMIFKDKEMLSLLKKLADQNGLLILTDSDNAGFKIRNYIKSCLPHHNIKHAFIPSVEGKERRKEKPGKEGLLGVEGMRDEALLQAISQAVSCCEENKDKITKYDLYRVGLSGGPDSRQKREKFAESLDLPRRLSANMMLDILNALYDREKFFELL